MAYGLVLDMVNRSAPGCHPLNRQSIPSAAPRPVQCAQEIGALDALLLLRMVRSIVKESMSGDVKYSPCKAPSRVNHSPISGIVNPK